MVPDTAKIAAAEDNIATFGRLKLGGGYVLGSHAAMEVTQPD
jgi:hypothetical protein